MATPNITERIARSLTLLRVFILASALLLGAAAVGLGFVLTHALRQQAIEDAQVSLTEYTNGLLHREIVHGGRIVVGHRAKGLVKSSLEARSDIFSVKVWRLDGVLAWTNVDPGAHRQDVSNVRAPARGDPDARGSRGDRGPRFRRECGRSAQRRSPCAGGLRPCHRGRQCDRRPGDLCRLVADRVLDRLTRSTSSGSRPSLSSLSSGASSCSWSGARRARCGARPISFASARKTSWPPTRSSKRARSRRSRA